jgi:D-alanyl-D-alanine carboxypeptidase
MLGGLLRLGALCGVLGFPAGGCAAHGPGAVAQSAVTLDLARVVAEVRARQGVPALAAATIENGRINAVACEGVRRSGDATPVTPDDRWHIGSCTKGMTAALAALLVQERRLRWDTTVGEAFGPRAAALDESCRGITLEQLLTHRAGVLPFTAPSEDPGLWRLLTADRGTPTEQRLELVSHVLARPPRTAPGAQWAYSNAGYLIAAAMLERVTGIAWEDLMQQRVFGPLGLTSAGFGPPASAQVPPSGPWGHRALPLLGLTLNVTPGPDADNPPAFNPAGRVHLTIGDFARYAAACLAAARGDHTWLNADATRHLFEPASDNGYAMGWMRHPLKGLPRPLLLHDGSNGTFYSLIVLDIANNRALVVATNHGDARGARALGDMAVAWGTPPAAPTTAPGP